MKKILFILFLFVIVIIGKAQTVYFAEYIGQAYKYSDYGKWDYQKPSQVFRKITMHNNTLLIDDIAESTYRLHNVAAKQEGKYTYTIWNAVDEDGEVCQVKLSFKEGNKYMELVVFYDNRQWAIYYWVDPKKKY